ncbi:GntR family transcriptional regulator [Ligilactobacillus salitolerans]|uniref:GntR family transcriptional regulator n=2 Tax=Ligilactobacillus salitolerans TaxID=1808352 RepID=A0A401IQL0_9LACO|nr:GntR family transcriptional regulator [Ligilactobacillus salitolerans]
MKFMDDVPIYRQIAQFLAREIISGRIQPGAQLASVRQLALQFSVNTNTVQRALREMIANNILQSRRGTGNFVTQDLEVIERIREKAIQQSILGMYDQLHALNISDEDIRERLNKFLEQRRDGDGERALTKGCLL